MDESNVKEMMEKAIAEIRKIKHEAPKDHDDFTRQEGAKKALDQAVSFADNALKRLVAHTVGRDVNELFDECMETRGQILIEEKNNGKYTLELDIVPKDYMLDLGHFKNNKNVKDGMIFLLNAVKILYCPIKDHMKALLIDSSDTFNYVLQIGLNTTLFLDKDSEKRIGIVLTPVES